MLSADEFVTLVEAQLARPLNVEQRRCVEATESQPLLIIAGPGTGKTTVMVLRALRHLLVDAIPPEQIVITTFTKKAAQEVRTRWLDWGLPLLEAARRHASTQSVADRAWLERADLNRCVTGTLDSICEEMLSEYREPGTMMPVLIEGYPANQRLLRAGLRDRYRTEEAQINDYLARYTFDGNPPRTLGDLIKTTRPLLDRFINDQVDVAGFRASTPHTVAKEALAGAYEAYRAVLSQDSQMDFALLEQSFFDQLRAGALDEAVTTWRAVLVDEYQDTNPLQELIYFEIARRSHAAMSVVGDDDQSLYRFRGATVELFTDFVARLNVAIGEAAHVEYLYQNYRSTPEIATFFNGFVQGDVAFGPARIQPPKPVIRATRPDSGLPVLGLFRPTAQDLAHDLSGFLASIFRGHGVDVALPSGLTLPLRRAVAGGDFGDSVYLGHSVNEYGRAMFGQPPSEKFPLLLRRELAAREVPVFNPRGQALADQRSVQILLGLVLECLDRSSAASPSGALTPAVMGLTRAARDKLDEWRARATGFIATRPAPGGLDVFVEAWAAGRSQTGAAWPEDWPVLELLFKLISWMPEFQHDPEHQVWLEAISRACAQARMFSPYGGSLLAQAPHRDRSRDSVIRDILRPIAEGLVEVDEDLIPSVPRDRMCLMTIHQSKGLEFPLVIVDVSANFRTNHRATAGMRFPARPSNVAMMEDDLAAFTTVGASRSQRSALDRSFDDLMRLYYVAYSRAQTALLLVGHETCVATRNPVKTVATGWNRNDTWKWHDPSVSRSTFANKLPLVML